jgi:putative addiction module killer protein
MEIVPGDVRNYVTPDGREPYEEWVNSLRNRKTRAIIRERINRLHLGNFGDYKRLTAALYELRINYGPGYRVYFGEVGSVIVILLCGGSKKTQRRDIQKAKEYWEELRNRADE